MIPKIESCLILQFERLIRSFRPFGPDLQPFYWGLQPIFGIKNTVSQKQMAIINHKIPNDACVMAQIEAGPCGYIFVIF